ncbi:unnamed protein product [Protopolystoma xenopodis]|uniref:Uncharacterized protein n=1 Tax=Protopolystoma xenopodis TaxID=117903 RepID=A0A3S5FC25_9PLAT|nr:unnamed protein product [Protopolystoma xenopodis]
MFSSFKRIGFRIITRAFKTCRGLITVEFLPQPTIFLDNLPPLLQLPVGTTLLLDVAPFSQFFGVCKTLFLFPINSHPKSTLTLLTKLSKVIDLPKLQIRLMETT